MKRVEKYRSIIDLRWVNVKGLELDLVWLKTFEWLLPPPKIIGDE